MGGVGNKRHKYQIRLELIANQQISIFSNVFISGIASEQKIPPAGLATLPRFLRFTNVRLLYRFGFEKKPIVDGSECIERQLLPLKPFLYNSTMIAFYPGTISQNDRSCFSDDTQLLEYIRNRLLSICASSRGYKFNIWYSTNTDDCYVIQSLLQMTEIKRCLKLEIELLKNGERKGQLPVEAISTWLNDPAMEWKIRKRNF